MKNFMGVVCAVVMAWGSVAGASDKNWKNEAQLSFLSARGNSESKTLGAGNKYHWARDKWGLNLWANALNVKSGAERTSERYEVGEKPEWKLDARNYVFQRGVWESNRFSGFSHRYDVSAGLGRQLWKSPSDDLIAELGAGYVNEQRISVPRNDFGAGRAYGKYLRTLMESSSFSQDAEYLHNFDKPNGYRLNTESAFITALSAHLSFKASYTWKHVHVPPSGFKRDDSVTLLSLLVNY